MRAAERTPRRLELPTARTLRERAMFGVHKRAWFIGARRRVGPGWCWKESGQKAGLGWGFGGHLRLLIMSLVAMSGALDQRMCYPMPGYTSTAQRARSRATSGLTYPVAPASPVLDSRQSKGWPCGRTASPRACASSASWSSQPGVAGATSRRPARSTPRSPQGQTSRHLHTGIQVGR